MGGGVFFFRKQSLTTALKEIEIMQTDADVTSCDSESVMSQRVPRGSEGLHVCVCFQSGDGCRFTSSYSWQVLLLFLSPFLLCFSPPFPSPLSPPLFHCSLYRIETPPPLLLILVLDIPVAWQPRSPRSSLRRRTSASQPNLLRS